MKETTHLLRDNNFITSTESSEHISIQSSEKRWGDDEGAKSNKNYPLQSRIYNNWTLFTQKLRQSQRNITTTKTATAIAEAEKKRHKLLSGKVGKAAYFIRDAVLGDSVEDPYDDHTYDPYSTIDSTIVDTNHIYYRLTLLRNYIAIYCRRLSSNHVALQILYGTIGILILLTFIEPPHWCRTMDCSTILHLKGIPAAPSYVDSSTTGNDETTISDVLYYPNTSTSIWLTVSQSHAIEMTCIIIVWINIIFHIGRDGMSISIYLRRRRQQQQQNQRFMDVIQFNRWIQIICLVILSFSLYIENKLPDQHFTQYNPYLRLLLLYTFLGGGSQRDIHVLMGVLPEVLNILFLLFVLMLFYAWFGVVVFVDTKEGEELFPTLLEGLWTLWICVTTANYPDVMMPAYNQNRFVTLYFISFMILSYFFLMNVILATVCNEYDTTIAEHRSNNSKMSTNNLLQAYQLLLEEEKTSHIDDGNESNSLFKADSIDRKTVMDLFFLLNYDFPEFRQLSNDETQILFAILDRDGTSKITKEEFMNFGNVLMLELYKSSDYASSIEVYFPKFFHSPSWQKFRTIIMAPYFEYVIDTILIMNAIVIGVQSWPLLSGQKIHLNSKLVDGSIDTIWEVMETGFTIIYMIEAVFKISVYGWKTYCEKLKNLFDFTITILAIMTTCTIYYPNDYSDSRLIRMILSARVLRLVRLLTALQPFQQLGNIFAVILPAAKNVMIVLFITMYFFAALGMHLYGGMITRDPNNPLSYLLLNTDFSNSEYWANNFNDMIGGMNVLFNLLVVNNWFVCQVAYEAVTQSKWVRLFFVGFHIMGVILVNNLVIAFIINKFLQQMALVKEESKIGVEHIGQSVHIQEDRAMFDASKVTGTVTNVQGEYVARFRHHESHSSGSNDDQQDREKFRTLFTQSSSFNGTE